MKHGKTKSRIKPKIKKRRGISRYIVTYLLIFLSLPVLYLAARFAASRVDYFTIERIEIVGNVNLNSSFLEEMSSGFIGMNLYSISKQNISLKYENIVRVKDTKIGRVLPDKLRIKIIERIGYLYIKTIEGYLIPIDREMIVLDSNGSYISEDLPVVDTDLSIDALSTGSVLENEFIEQVMLVHSAIERSRIDPDSISEYYRVDNDLFFIEAKTGARICLGAEDYEDRLSKLEFVWENVGIETHRKIDLRFNNQVVLK